MKSNSNEYQMQGEKKEELGYVDGRETKGKIARKKYGKL